MTSEVLNAPGERRSGRFSGAARLTSENIVFAMTALRAHKLRSFLTVVGIVIGVSTVIAMVSSIVGFSNSVTEDFEAFGATLVQFQKYDPQFGPGNHERSQRVREELTIEDARALKELVPEMAAVSPERYWDGPDDSQIPDAKYKAAEATPDTIIGVTEDYTRANNRFVGEGRFITPSDVLHSSDVVVIGADIANVLFANLDPLGRQIMLRGRSYTVVGVMVEEGSTFFESSDQHIYMPISTFDDHFPWVKRERGVNIATVPHSPDQVDTIIEKGSAVLRVRRNVPFNEPNDFGIMTPDKMIGNFRQVTGGIALAMIFISSIALIVGGVGVMNIMLVSVTERTREIGIRKAVGAVRKDIVVQFLTEAMTLSGIGGVLGIVLGIAIAVVVGAATPLETATPLWSILLAFGVSVSIGLFFGIYPAWKAAKLDPIEALRYE